MLSDKNPGLKCPQCQSHIEIQVEQLFNNIPIICSKCSLSLEVNKQKSRASLNALKKFRTEQQKAQDKLKKSGSPGK